MLLSSPEKVFAAIWSTYFEGKIGKLAIHPMSNFVVAKAIERLSKEGVERVVTECKAVSGGRGMISTSTFTLFSVYDNSSWIRIS
jgi:nucleolar protein 9